MTFSEKLPDLASRAVADPRAVLQGPEYRFTVLTQRLIRMEYAADGAFEDAPSRTAWYRDFPVPEFTAYDTPDRLEIVTPFIHLYYDKKEFSANSLYADVFGSSMPHGTRWYYGAKQEVNSLWGNLGGTARTLDAVDGETPLECGLASRNGFAALDDSQSHLLAADGSMRPRALHGGKPVVDLYFFGYALDYKGALRDFYRLSGPVPLLPRYALGNWWSRYYAYTQDEYLALMERFRAEDLPFSVSVIDMDWHLTSVDPKYGSGWTGYTWNRKLFPDPDAFLARLHELGLRVTLNLHPADGIRAFEDCYPAVARAVGIDPATEKPAEFDLTSPEFVRAYFEHAHHPLERQGVDFWWIDWQQGASTRVPGLDPLWILNHYHSYDISHRMIFSRYAGPGSHRYPVGFSGDTIASWDSLRFQPYFTAAAANIGYGWWSHDIGGHMLGVKDDEMVTRWVQFGAFSPINRLHSSCSPFNGKEPWRYGGECRAVISEFLRLRHRLVPYLHSMNRAASVDGRPIALPVYYEYPASGEAYEIRNEYWFGTELLCVPVTEPVNRSLCLAGTRVWLPSGLWTDFFSGQVYDGREAGPSGRFMYLFRSLESLPVLARAGAIVPLSRSRDVGVPSDLEVLVFPGASNRFELFEDESSTVLSLEWNDDGTARFTVSPASGDPVAAGIPARRSWTLSFRGFGQGAELASCGVGPAGTSPAAHARMAASEDSRPATRYDRETDTLSVDFANVPTDSGCFAVVRPVSVPGSPDAERMRERIYRLLDRAQIPFVLKDQVWNLVNREKPGALAAALAALPLDRELLLALFEHLPR